MTQTEPLNIRLVDGWSIRLHEREDVAMKWGATATRAGEETQFGIGVDETMSLLNVARKCGINGDYVLRQFGH